MNKKNAFIFFAHSLLRDDNPLNLHRINSLVENFGKIQHLINELVDVGYDVCFLLGVDESKSCISVNNVGNKVFQSSIDIFSSFLSSPPDLLIVWNGYDYESRKIVSWADATRVRVMYLEYGFFLQKHYIRFDSRGLLASSFMPDAKFLLNISDVEVERWLDNCFKLFSDINTDYHKYRKIEKTLVVLQTDYDSSLLIYSPYETVEKFVNSFISDKDNLDNYSFRLHPHTNPDVRDWVFNKVGDNNIDKIINPLLSVYLHRNISGVNSTLLLEAVCLGKNIEMYGLGYPYMFNRYMKNLVTVEGSREEWLNFLKLVYFSHQYMQFHVDQGFSRNSRQRLNEICQ